MVSSFSSTSCSSPHGVSGPRSSSALSFPPIRTQPEPPSWYRGNLYSLTVRRFFALPLPVGFLDAFRTRKESSPSLVSESSNVHLPWIGAQGGETS